MKEADPSSTVTEPRGLKLEILEAAARLPVESREAVLAVAGTFIARLSETERRLEKLEREFSAWRNELHRLEQEELADVFEEALDVEKQ